MSHLHFFGFLCCFRQGWVHVTLRNKNNIGLPWFTPISSSDFWLLCRCLMVEKGDIVTNCPKQSETVSKMMSSHRRSLVRVYWEYFCWFQKCFRHVLFVQWTFDPIFCHRGYVQQYNTLMPQPFGIFLTSPSSFSFLAFLYFATLKASFPLCSSVCVFADFALLHLPAARLKRI